MVIIILVLLASCATMDIHFSYLNTIIPGIIAILILSYYVLQTSKSGKGPKAPEAGGGWPLIGHLHLLGGSRLPHITLGALADKYGPIFTIRVGIHPTVVISSWEVAKECYTTHDVAVSSRPKFLGAKHLGYNYANFGFCPYGDYWRELRKITASELLSNRRLEQFKPIRGSEIKNSLKELYKTWSEKQSESETEHITVEMKEWIGNINLNVVLMMVCGKRCFGGNEKRDVRKSRDAMREFFRLTGLFVVGDALPFLGWLDLGGHVKAMKKTARDLDDLASEWLDEHRKKRNDGSDHSDFMDVMLSVLDGIDLASFDADTVNKATCMTIIIGGTDTTTVTLVWALALLLNNPMALKKAQEEIDTQVGKERLVEESDISKLVYLQAIVKETLRLYPAGPLSGIRELTQDCTISGYHVPAGTRLITNLWKIQTDARVWSDPLEFKPERFLTTHKDVDVQGKHFELIPFGGGRRACPGLGFALQMTNLVLASLLHAFDITTRFNAPVDMVGSFGLTNIKATPLHVLAKPRLSSLAYE